MKKIYSPAILLITLALLLKFSTASAQCTYTAGVPYLESFSGITTASPLPQCWITSNSLTAFTTPSLGNASFYYNPASTSYFTTHGIQLHAGIVYSVGLFYLTPNFGTWTELSILMGNTQVPANSSTIATMQPPSNSLVFLSLSNTLTVNTSGIYYFSIKGVSNGLSLSQYLILDDFSVTAPCSLNPVNVTASASSNTLCQGQSATLSATGAHTYSWSNGSTGPGITVTPNSSVIYNVTGTNTLTGCTASVVVFLVVNPNPVGSVITPITTVCQNDSIVLNAISGNSVTVIWSTGQTGSPIYVKPQVNTVYSFTATNSFSCKVTSSVNIVVNALPTVVASPAIDTVCIGQEAVFVATGASLYSWIGNSSAISGNTFSVFPTASSSYTVIGTDANGCKNNFVVQVIVDQCSGLYEAKSNTEISVFPNPIRSTLFIESQGSIMGRIRIMDFTGREIITLLLNDHKGELNLDALPGGVYFLHCETEQGRVSYKVVKE